MYTCIGRKLSYLLSYHNLYYGLDPIEKRRMLLEMWYEFLLENFQNNFLFSQITVLRDKRYCPLLVRCDCRGVLDKALKTLAEISCKMNLLFYGYGVIYLFTKFLMCQTLAAMGNKSLET